MSAPVQRPRSRQKASINPSQTVDWKVKRALVDLLSGFVENVEVKSFDNLKARFSDAESNKAFKSWTSRGPNVEPTPDILRTAFKSTRVLKYMEERSGLPEEQVLERLTFVLPEVIGEVIPFGDESPNLIKFHLQSLRRRLPIFSS